MSRERIIRQIQATVDDFVADVTSLATEAALSAAAEALASTAGGRRPAASVRIPGAPRRGRPRSPLKRNPKLEDSILTAVSAHQRDHGQAPTASQIARRLDVHALDLQDPILSLVEMGRLTKTGRRRGTRYHRI